MTEKVRMPADLDQVTLKLLGKLDAKDLARLGIPSGSAFSYLYQIPSPSLTAFAGAGAAVGIGATWALWKPYGRSLDQNLYQAARWTLQNRNGVETPEIEDNVLKTGSSVAALIEVDPVNMELKSGGEKAALHKLYQELLQSVDYPVTVYSTQQPFSFAQYFENLEDGDELQDDYRSHCEDLVEDGNSRTRHYLEVRVDDGDRSELSNRVGEILEHLTSGGLTTYRVTEVDDVEDSPEINPRYIQHPESEERSCSKTLYISGYPGDVDFSWISQILQVEGLIDVTQTIYPKTSADTVSKLQKLENKAEAENQSLVRKGYGSSRKLERLLDDVDWFQNLLADQEDQPVRYGCYVTAYGESKKECEAAVRKVENRLKTLGINYRGTALRTDQAYQSTTPGLRDKLEERQLMPAGSAASGFPFTQASTVDENGVLFGVDQSTEAPVILDRFKWNAGHAVLAGATGSGKSFHSKLLLLRSAQVYDNLEVKIIDPKPEYGDLEDFLEEYASVTRFGLEASIQDDTEELIQSVEEAYSQAQESDAKTIVVIDEAHRLLQNQEGASVLSTLVREARSSNTAVQLITQTISDFYRTEDGEDILKNIPCKVLFAHEDADDRPAQAFQLSNVAETRLYNLAKGDQDSTDYSQAILKVSNQFESRVNVEASDVEASIIEHGEIPEQTRENTGSIDLSYNETTSDADNSSLAEKAKAYIKNVREKIEKLSLPNFNLPKPGLPSFSLSNSSYLRSSNARSWNNPLPDIEDEIPYRGYLKKACFATGLFFGTGLFGAILVSSGRVIVDTLQQLVGFGSMVQGVLEVVCPLILLGALFGLSDPYTAIHGDDA
ncbi:VirB4 family type IV secretion system protein [Haloplanus natans]|uniref:VirB4 family type IV secretion system protein n=1 Tax=Haloplanus natans TaxID=376171 RepID=UPI000677EC3D|nr:ATP-binding protein [Haloplanus natans]